MLFAQNDIQNARENRKDFTQYNAANDDSKKDKKPKKDKKGRKLKGSRKVVMVIQPWLVLKLRTHRLQMLHRHLLQTVPPRLSGM